MSSALEAAPVLVTGISRGIGKAIADALVAQGRRVLGVSRSRPDGFVGEHHAIDLADAGAADALAELCRRERPLGLVANAGVVASGSLDAVTAADMERTFRVNVEAVVWAMQAVAPAMREARAGRIVVLGSRAALGKTERIAYSASKAAVGGVVRSAALELAPFGVTVNVVAPGPIETEMFRQNQPPGSEARRRIEETVPVARLGRPEEVARAVLYFLDADAGFTTGQTLHVCGGLTIGAVS